MQIDIKHNWFFLVTGVVLVIFGYVLLPENPSNVTSSPNWGSWSFGSTLLGGLILGKWLSDSLSSKKKKK